MKQIESSHTCPQCWREININNIHKIYCKFSYTDGTITNRWTLQYELDVLQSEMSLKEQKLKDSETNCKTLETQIFNLRERVKYLEDKETLRQDAMLCIKDQLVQKLKSELDQLESIEMVLSESQSKVDDLLKQCKEPNQQVILDSVLEKEPSDLERIGDLHTKLIGYKNQLSEHKRTIVELEHELEKCRSVENESVKHVVMEQSPDLNSKTEIRKENPQLDDSHNH